jgi:hypothetical protein
MSELISKFEDILERFIDRLEKLVNRKIDDPDDIDLLVPPKIFRLGMHLHNMIYIRFFYENIGQQPPKWTTKEMERVERITISYLDRENAQGGAFYKRSAE